MITIKPIFDQYTDARVWKDFSNVEFIAAQGKPADSNINHLEIIQQLYKYEWNTKSFPFAFGAYDLKDNMVGFTKGHIVFPKEHAYISCLYVLPEYQLQGIGKRLLKAAEKSASLYVSFAHLKSLPDAERFYMRQGYDPYYRRYAFSKILKIPYNEIVPIFGWHEELDKKLACDITDKVKDNNKEPMFVHMNSESKIDGVIIRDQTTKFMQDHCMYKSAALKDSVNKQLVLTLSKFGRLR